MASKKRRKSPAVFKKVKNGEEIEVLLPADVIDICCDCGLVHFTHYSLKGKKLIIKTFRDDYLTQKYHL